MVQHFVKQTVASKCGEIEEEVKRGQLPRLIRRKDRRRILKIFLSSSLSSKYSLDELKGRIKGIGPTIRLFTLSIPGKRSEMAVRMLERIESNLVLF